jgi:hypothetical protein
MRFCAIGRPRRSLTIGFELPGRVLALADEVIE